MPPQPKRVETSRADVQAEGLAVRGSGELSVKMEGGDKWISSHIDCFTYLLQCPGRNLGGCEGG